MNFLFQSGDGGVGVAALQAALCEREAEIRRLKEELKASAAKRDDVVTQVSLKTKLHPKYGKKAKHVGCVFTVSLSYPQVCITVIPTE